MYNIFNKIDLRVHEPAWFFMANCDIPSFQIFKSITNDQKRIQTLLKIVFFKTPRLLLWWTGIRRDRKKKKIINNNLRLFFLECFFYKFSGVGPWGRNGLVIKTPRLLLWWTSIRWTRKKIIIILTKSPPRQVDLYLTCLLCSKMYGIP